MDRSVIGRDAPCLPRLVWDVPIFRGNSLVGVKRLVRWVIPAKPNSGYRVLVVDDLADVTDLLSELLRKRGFQVSTAYDGVAGLEAVRLHLPDLVLLNFIMPGLDGLQVLARLRADPRTARVKVIIHSATPIRERACLAGAHDFLKVPFACDELHASIARVLGA